MYVENLLTISYLEWGHESVNKSLTLINQLLPWKKKEENTAGDDESAGTIGFVVELV